MPKAVACASDGAQKKHLGRLWMERENPMASEGPILKLGQEKLLLEPDGEQQSQRTLLRIRKDVL